MSTIPDPLARELRALNDLELGVFFARSGVCPRSPHGGKLAAALTVLTALAEDGPWWTCTAAEWVAEAMRINASAPSSMWKDLACLGAVARKQLPDPDRESETAAVHDGVVSIGAADGAAAILREDPLPPGDSFCYLPAEPDDLEVFDTAISAIWSDRLSGRITDAQVVKHEDAVRTQRDEFLMRRGE